MATMTISLTMAGGAALLHLWHFARCVIVRGKAKILHGDGGNALMAHRMRAHANFIENTPLFLILLALVEYHAGASPWLWAAGYIFLLARIAHGIGMDKEKENLPRAAGMLLTILPLFALAAVALWMAVMVR